MKFVLLSLLLLPAARAADVPVPKAEFKKEFASRLAEKFCEEKRYFRVCFNAKAEDCKKNVGTAVAACLAEMDAQLPETFHQPADGQKWGEKLGNCAGGKYEADQAKNIVNSADCKNLEKWK
jgi:hypothetical protein